jgi:DNA-binding MarR family transcriptional regulator
MNAFSSQERYLELLEQIEEDPNTTQATLADRMGVAIGTVNWHLKRMIEKGYIKATRAGRRKLRYIITAEGIALRAKLTVDYIKTSMDLYRLIRKRMTAVAQKLADQGVSQIHLTGGAEDIRDICCLTCLEHGIEIAPRDSHAPVVVIDHLKIILLDATTEVP